MKEYRVCCREHGIEHTAAVKFRDWGGRQNWQGNATDELRRLLDERGVEWRKTPHYSSESQDNETVFEGNGIEWYANDHMNGRLGLRALRYNVTPEQAIDATLGRGTCEVECFDDGMDEGMDGEWFAYATATWHLSCGHEVYGSERPRYCSVCGKRVVEP